MSAIRAADCPRERLIVDFSRGKLDDATAETVSAHLETCVDCRAAADRVAADSFIQRLRAAHGQIPAAAALSSQADSVSRADSATVALKPAAAQVSPSESAKFSLPAELVDHPDYELIKELGRGGMGVVYLARNRPMDRLEVLKVVSKSLVEQPGARERFQREIRSAAKLSHPNIVAAYSVPRAGDLLIFAMEHVAGQDLSQVVKQRGPLPVVNAAYYAHQVALGLQHAHEQEMVHRDIKPNNLILSVQAKRHLVKILDFGLAKATSEKLSSSELTGSGQMLGTPDYMAPEQSLDAHEADIRADIYSLGCTLYYMLAGRAPFQGPSMYAVLSAHHSNAARLLSEVRSDVPAELAAVVAKMMAKDPADRYQTPADVSQALGPFFRATGGEAAKLTPMTEEAASREIPVDVFDPYYQWLGIAPEEQPVDHYRLLGAQRFEANLEVIANLADQRVAHLRTFQGGQHSALSRKLLDEVAAARVCLLKADRKAAYDAELRRMISAPPRPLPAAVAPLAPPLAAVVAPEAAPPALLELSPARRAVAWSKRTMASLRARLGAHRFPPAVRYTALASFAALIVLCAVVIKLSTPDGDVTIEVNKPNAEVASDGQKATVQWDNNSKKAEISVPAGSHKVEVTKDGVKASGQEVIVEDNGSKVLTAKLDPPVKPTTAVIPPDGQFPLGQWIDVLRLVDTKSAMVVEGNWSRNGEEITTEPGQEPRVEIPVVVKGSYDLEIEFTRISGENSVCAMLPVGSHSCMVILSGWSGTASGLNTINGNSSLGPDNPTTVRPGTLQNGHRYRLSVSTRIDSGDRASVDVSLDGKPYFPHWSGDITRLGMIQNWKMPNPTEPGLGVNDAVTFHSARLKMLSGSASLDPALITVNRPIAVATPGSGSEPGPAKPPAFHEPAFQQWVDQVAAMEEPERQVAAVMRKLSELNPGFEHKETHVIRDNFVWRFSFSTDQVSDISPVRALAKLCVLECAGSTAGSGRLSDLSPLKGMHLSTLVCNDTRVSDLSPLAGMPLSNLSIYGDPVSDLSPIRGMQLATLVAQDTRIDDLSPLKGMPIRCLNCERTRVADLSPLAGAPMTTLFMRDTRVTDLSALKGMELGRLSVTLSSSAKNIEVLRPMQKLNQIIVGTTAANRLFYSNDDFWKKYDAGEFGKPDLKTGAPEHQRVSTFDDPPFIQWANGVAALSSEQQVAAVVKKLQELNPGFDGKETHEVDQGVVTALKFVTGKVTDISPVRALKGLKTLSCDGAGWNDKGALSDLSPLEGLPLMFLDCDFTSVSDLSPLRGMRLTKLCCGITHVSDLSPLQGMPLKVLKCGVTSVSDLSPLKGMSLTEFHCDFTPVSDLSPLKGMPIENLLCHRTKVQDLSPLRGMPLVNLQCGESLVSDLSPLKGMPLKELTCEATPASDLSPLAGMSLTTLYFTPKNITKGIDVVRGMKSLNEIGLGWSGKPKFPPELFWKKYDAGDFK